MLVADGHDVGVSNIIVCLQYSLGLFELILRIIIIRIIFEGIQVCAILLMITKTISTTTTTTARDES